MLNVGEMLFKKMEIVEKFRNKILKEKIFYTLKALVMM